MKKLRAVWEVTRLEHGLIYGLGVVAGVYIALGHFDLELSVFGFLTALFLQASAFALNDYYDYEVDRANRRLDRPLVRGDLSRSEALWISVILAVPGFLFALYISTTAFILALAITALGYLYDIKLKEYGVAGNIYIAFSMAAPFLFGAIVAGNVNAEVSALSAIAFLSGLAREIMKGIEDIEGDALRDVKTVARVYGEGVAGKVSALLFTLAVISSIAVLLIPDYRDPKYIIPVSVTDYILLSTSRKLLKGVGREEIGELRRKTMLALAVGLLAFLLGSM
ncbi:UbiA family prenyltransferase [Geoglobus sp.]